MARLVLYSCPCCQSRQFVSWEDSSLVKDAVECGGCENITLRVPIENLGYPVLVSIQEGKFVVESQSWKGCLSHSNELDSAFSRFEEAKLTWLEDCLDREIEVPYASS